MRANTQNRKGNETDYNSIVDELLEFAPPYNKGERAKPKSTKRAKKIIKQKFKRRRSLRLYE
jgi:hypothetical protein